MTRRTVPFEVPEGMPGAWRGLQERLNSYASRGMSVTVPLRDAHEGGRGLFQLVGNQLWGTNSSTYIANSRTCTALSTRAPAINTLHAVPFLHDNNFLISRVGCRVTTGTVGSSFVLGIYDCVDDTKGAFYPNRRLWNSASFTSTGSGVTHEANPSLTLTPGRMYWAVYHPAVLAPTVSAIPVASVDNILGTVSGAGGITPQTTHLTVARTYSATLPETFPSGANVATTTPPAIFVGYTGGTSGSIASTVPLFTPADGGWSLKRAWLMAGSPKNGETYSTVAVRVVTATGATTLGTFDSRTNRVGPGYPFLMTGQAPIDFAVPVGAFVDAYVVQRGWPLMSVNDCAVQLDLARTEV